MRADQLAGLEPPEVLGQALGGRVAIAGRPRHRGGDDGGELGRHGRRELGEGARRPGLDRGEDLLDGAAIGVRPLAAEDVIEDRADRIDVGARVERLTGGLLGRHVRRRADDRAGDGGAGIEVARVDDRRARRRVVAAEVAREAPVDHHGLAVRADQHVGRLEVAVDHALAVRVGQRLGDGDHVRQEREARRRGGGLGDQRVEGAATHQLHRVERLAARPAPDLVDRHDRRVLQVGGHHRLACEPRDQIGGGPQHFFQRDHAAGARIARAVHAAEAAARQLAEQLEAIPRHLVEAFDRRGVELVADGPRGVGAVVGARRRREARIAEDDGRQRGGQGGVGAGGRGCRDGGVGARSRRRGDGGVGADRVLVAIVGRHCVDATARPRGSRPPRR